MSKLGFGAVISLIAFGFAVAIPARANPAPDGPVFHVVQGCGFDGTYRIDVDESDRLVCVSRCTMAIISA